MKLFNSIVKYHAKFKSKIRIIIKTIKIKNGKYIFVTFDLGIINSTTEHHTKIQFQIRIFGITVWKGLTMKIYIFSELTNKLNIELSSIKNIIKTKKILKTSLQILIIQLKLEMLPLAFQLRL